MDKSLFIFPRGFLALTLVLTLSMAGFALVQGLLTLYCSQLFNFSDKQAYLLSSAFMTIVFSLPVISGYLCERFLSYAFATIICLLIAISGLYSLCFQSIDHFYSGLALFAVGNSITVACLFIMLGRLLRDNKSKRTAGFTVAYTCMNTGAFISLLLSGTIVRNWGYQAAFLLSTILLLSAAVTLLLNLRNIVTPYSNHWANPSKKQHAIGILCIVALVPIVIFLLKSIEQTNRILLVVIAIASVFILQIWRSATGEQRRNLRIFLIVTVFGIFFWALYALEPSVLTLFIERNVDRTFLGFSIPSSDFFSLNPLFIIILGVLFSFMWLSFARGNRSPSLPYKFAAGIGLVGVAYLLLSASTYFANEQGLISMGWIILSYIMLGAAELFISPVGLSMVGVLADSKHEGVLMGIWLLSNGVGGSFSAYLSESIISSKQTISPLITNGLYGYRFCEFGLTALLIGAILALLGPRLIDAALAKSS